MDLHRVKTGKNRFEKKSNDDTFKSFRNSRNEDRYRYSKDRKESTKVVCDDCGLECKVPFVPKTDKPVYCTDCFRKNSSRNQEQDRYSRYDKSPRNQEPDRFSRDYKSSRFYKEDRRESAIVPCDNCGIDFRLPFLPKFDKPVYCQDCFRKDHSQYLGQDKFSKSDKVEPWKKDFKSKSKDKFSKKQESFFSGGSDKFYNTLKEKLFEILGGKVCSSCGFDDERALGFKNIYDDESFDNIRRGGVASSWGKYISDPELAKEELEILCLNCNELSKSAPSSGSKTQNFKKKKNRFPR